MTAPTLTVVTRTAWSPADTTETPAEQSALYAAILANMLKENPTLPVLIWAVYPSGLVGRAVGTSDWVVAATVRTWARAFKVRAEVLSLPCLVLRRHTFGDGWAVEPGEIKAQILAAGYDICVVGELVEVQPGDSR
jgi:hypothetical protein